MQQPTSFIRSKLARRIFLLFVCCALLPVCALATVTVWQIAGKIHQQNIDTLRRESKDVGMTIYEGLALLQSQLHSAATAISGGGKPTLPPALALPMGQQQGFSSITVVTEETQPATQWAPFIRSHEARNHLAGNEALLFFTTTDSDPPKLHMASRIPNNSPSMQLLIGEVSRNYLPTLISYTLSGNLDIQVLDATGFQIYSSNPATTPSMAKSLAEQVVANGGHFEWRSDDRAYHANHWTVFLQPLYQAPPWTVLAIQPATEVTTAIQAFAKPFILIIGLTLSVVVLVSSVQIRRSLVPLTLLREGARKISQGDFQSRLTLPSNDEFADLATTFNDMSTQLQHQFCTVKEMSRLVQDILEAQDRDRILSSVLTGFRKIMPCEWLSIFLLDKTTGNTGQVVSNRYAHGILSAAKISLTTLSEQDLSLLETTDNAIELQSDSSFSYVLSNLTEQGAANFILLPIRIKQRVGGLLAIGFRQPATGIDDDLIRARQIVDEIAVALDNIRLIDQLQRLNLGTIEALAKAVDAKSPWTAGHSERVTQLALKIGHQLGLDDQSLEQLHWAGLFHDIGKIAIPGSILDKPGPLTDQEYALLQSHPQKGADILRPIEAYQEALPIIAQHHEWFDGSGYPAGLSCEEINLGARILAVADVFDALFSDRPYRAGWQHHKVIAYISDKSASQFDPAVVKALLKVHTRT